MGALSVSLLFSATAFSQALTVEHFDYAQGTILKDLDSWTAHSGEGTNSLAVIESNLTYPGYPAMGNAVGMVKTGEDINHQFEGQTTGMVYASFLANFSDAGIATAGDYFMHFMTAETTTFRGRVFVRKHETEPKLSFGITRGASGGSAVWSNFVYDLNTTHLIVLKYEFVEGDANDICSLIINPTVGSEEPVATVANAEETQSDFSTDFPLNALALRQGSSVNGSVQTVDGIQVATSWDALFPNTESEILTFDFMNAEVVDVAFSPVMENMATITVEVAFGTDVTTLTPTMTISEGATVMPEYGIPTDFTSPVTYTVTAEDGMHYTMYDVVVVVGEDSGINTFPYAQNFEVAEDLVSWMVVDVDGAGTIWDLSTSQNHTEGGTTSARHNYAAASAGNQEGWLITPAVHVPAEGEYEMSFWHYNQFPTYYGKNSVKISTGSANPADGQYTEVWTVETVTATWEEVTIDLAMYAGQTIYIGWVYEGTDAHRLFLDDVTISEKATSYVVTFNVTDGTNAIEGATVAIASQNLTTDAMGMATISLENGTYPYVVSYAGMGEVSGDVVVDGADVTVPVTLNEAIETPFGLMVQVEGNDALFTWNNEMSETDDIESYDDFIIENIGDYTLVDVDGSTTYGITNTTFNNSGYTGSFIVFNPSATTPALTDGAWAPYSGSKYLACFAATTPSNNDWLITPMVVGMDGLHFSFMAKSITDQYGLERFKVAVSTTGTAPADFTVISEGSYVSVPTAWTEYSYDLSAYAGQEIYVAINCVSNDAFALFIDDITFGISKKASKDFLGYTVYLDGAQVAEGLTEEAYMFEDLAVGTYMAGVKSVYTSGESEMVSVEFEIPEAAYTVTFNVVGSGSPVNGATITINGETLTTNAAGVATIDLVDGTYGYTITKEGFDEYTEEVVVAGANVVENVTLIVGINDAVASMLNIYPNPASDVIFIERTTSDNAMVEIFNNSGIVVAKFEMNEARKEVSVSELNSGIYFIRMVGATTNNVIRFIKE